MNGGAHDLEPRLGRSANRLLDHARALRDDPTQQLDVLHILRAMLEDQKRGEGLFASPETKKVLRDPAIIERLREDIGLELELHPPDAGENGFSERLDACFKVACDSRPGLIGDTDIILAILRDEHRNNPARRIAQRVLGDHLGAITAELDKEVQPMPPQQLTHILPTLVEATAQFKGRHEEFLTSIIVALQGCQPPYIVVAQGKNGSALGVICEVLACAIPLAHTPASSRLDRYKSVATVHLGTILTLPQEEQAGALRFVFTQCSEAHSILVLKAMELLDREPEKCDQGIYEVIGNPGGTLVLGIYDEAEDAGGRYLNAHVVRPLETLHGTVHWLRVPEYNWDRFKNLIEQTYEARWNERGFALTAAAFETAFKLAPGMWVDKRRKVSPYLLIDAAEFLMQRIETIVSLHASEGDAGAQTSVNKRMGDLVRTAKDNVERLLGTEPDPNVANKYSPILRQVKEEFENLLGSTSGSTERKIVQQASKQQAGKWVLTSALINAQLLEGSSSTFLFPLHV